jgi:hypothetical protein
VRLNRLIDGLSRPTRRPSIRRVADVMGDLRDLSGREKLALSESPTIRPKTASHIAVTEELARIAAVSSRYSMGCDEVDQLN